MVSVTLSAMHMHRFPYQMMARWPVRCTVRQASTMMGHKTHFQRSSPLMKVASCRLCVKNRLLGADIEHVVQARADEKLQEKFSHAVLQCCTAIFSRNTSGSGGGGGSESGSRSGIAAWLYLPVDVEQMWNRLNNSNFLIRTVKSSFHFYANCLLPPDDSWCLNCPTPTNIMYGWCSTFN